MALEPNSIRQAVNGRSPGEEAARVVAAIVASAFTVPIEEIRGLGRRGTKPGAFARQVAMYLAHTRLGLSYTAAGALFGRDRTTAAHACHIVEDRREDGRIDAIVDCLERAIDRWPNLTPSGGGSN